MKKISKVLALLLALALVFSLAACGSSSSSSGSGSYDDDKGSSSSDKNDKNDKNDKTEPTEPSKPTDEETIVGTWVLHAEVSDSLVDTLKTQSGQQSLSSDKEVYLDLKFEFKDGKMTIKGDVDEDTYVALLIELSVNLMYISAEGQGMNKEAFDTAFQQQYGMTVNQYADNQVKLQVAQQQSDLHMSTSSKYYKVDAEAGKIYLASTEAGLEDTKEAIDYSIEDGKLTVKKVYDENGAEAAAPLEMEEVGVNLPWTFEKQ